MLRPLTLLFVMPATLAACDAAVRAALWWRARAARRRASPIEWPAGPGALSVPPSRLLVVIPARAEGERLLATLASAAGHGTNVLLLLDGLDAAAEAEAAALGVRVVSKTPGGPSKAAALSWLVREHRDLLTAFDAIMIIDAGSRFAPGFFDYFQWPGNAVAAQAYLSGTSTGVGAAAAASETIAQNGEDQGRESFGWNVRLRGTGTAFLTPVFLDLMPRLDTRVEDLEATLLLTARGEVIRMLDPRALVVDEKPAAVTAAASQRARWLLGRYELLLRRFPSFVRMIVLRPLEGLAFFVEIFGRPLTLTALLRLGAAALLLRAGWSLYAVALATTVAADVVVHRAVNRHSPGAVLRLAGSWLLALLLAPRALVRWMRP